MEGWFRLSNGEFEPMVLAQAVTDLCHDTGLELLMLFGSRARGSERPDSDFDLAVVPGPHFSGVGLDELGHSLSQQLGSVDLVCLTDSSWLLWAEVARDGQVVYENKVGTADRFRIEAALRKGDAFPWRWRNQSLINRFLEGDVTMNTDLVRRKLAMMVQYLHELVPVVDCPLDRFLSEPLTHHGAERLVELLVECAASINAEVARAEANLPAADYYSSFFSMAATGWVDQESATALADWARIRNALVHRYEDVGLEELWRKIRQSHSLWRKYVALVNARMPQVDPC